MVSNKKTPTHQNDVVTEYQQSREERIKENLQRMQKLGLVDLSRSLKPPPKPKPTRPHKPKPSSPRIARRSSRIQELPSVSYVEKRTPKKEKVVEVVEIVIKEGSRPEVYSEEHEERLGEYKEKWKLCVDGYDEEGNRMYDAYLGKSCHQCRQKTLGLRTRCCKCTSVQGQFCGDCLFMRYGENVEETNANKDWICPVCRDICNCSRCRRIKGWEPTGNLYKKATKLGYKSVAHYLIHTRGPHGKQEDIDNKTLGSPTDKESEQLDEKDDDNMDEDTNDNDRDQRSKEENDDVDSDYKSDPQGDDDDDDNDDDGDLSSADD